MASTSKRRQTAFAGIAGNQEIDVPDDESGSAEPDLTALEKKLQDLHEMIETRFEEQMKILKTVKNSRSSEGAESSNRDEVESQAQTESIGDGQESDGDPSFRDTQVDLNNTEEEDQKQPEVPEVVKEKQENAPATPKPWASLAKRTEQLLGFNKKNGEVPGPTAIRRNIVVHTTRPEAKTEDQSKIRKWSGVIVYSPAFSYSITLLILLHVILLGVEVDLSAAVALEDMPSWFSTFNAVSVCCFVVELILKFIALGCRGFWYGSDAYWNIFDFIVIGVSVVDVVLDFWARMLSPSMSTGQLRLLRSIRFARALRSIRIVRLFRYIGALRTLALSILSTMVSLFWTLALLIILFYSFGVVLTQLVVEHCRFLGMEAVSGKIAPMQYCPETLRKYWHNVPESMLTLFMAISQGLNWEDAMEPLREVSVLAVILVILYVVITVFAILNVVTGVFLNTAIESAGADKDVATIRQVHAKAQQVEALQQIFREIDRENDNEVNFEDVRNAMSSGELASFMESLGISTDDVRTLFMLLDSEHKGLIDLDEFVSGCMQLHGPAKSMQMAKMSYENKLTRQALQSLKKEIFRMRRGLKPNSKEMDGDTSTVTERF